MASINFQTINISRRHNELTLFFSLKVQKKLIFKNFKCLFYRTFELLSQVREPFLHDFKNPLLNPSLNSLTHFAQNNVAFVFFIF